MIHVDLIQMDDYPADSCTTSSTAFLLFIAFQTQTCTLPCPRTTKPVMIMMTSASVLMTVKMFCIRAAARTLTQFTNVRKPTNTVIRTVRRSSTPETFSNEKYAHITSLSTWC